MGKYPVQSNILIMGFWGPASKSIITRLRHNGVQYNTWNRDLQKKIFKSFFLGSCATVCLAVADGCWLNDEENWQIVFPFSPAVGSSVTKSWDFPQDFGISVWNLTVLRFLQSEIPKISSNFSRYSRQNSSGLKFSWPEIPRTSGFQKFLVATLVVLFRTIVPDLDHIRVNPSPDFYRKFFCSRQIDFLSIVLSVSLYWTSGDGYIVQ